MAYKSTALKLRKKDSGWAIFHVQSGKFLFYPFNKRKNALDCKKEIIPKLDWSKTDKELESEVSFYEYSKLRLIYEKFKKNDAV